MDKNFVEYYLKTNVMMKKTVNEAQGVTLSVSLILCFNRWIIRNRLVALIIVY